jgi:hypothetical protein
VLPISEIEGKHSLKRAGKGKIAKFGLNQGNTKEIARFGLS